MGMPKARVFPLPVSAAPRISFLPWMAAGRVRAWI